MSTPAPNSKPALHNAPLARAWSGKGEGSEPLIDLDTMLQLTAAAEVDGVRFDGVDLFLVSPHIDIDSSDDDLKFCSSDKIASLNLVVGSLVAPIWGRPAAFLPWAMRPSAG